MPYTFRPNPVVLVTHWEISPDIRRLTAVLSDISTRIGVLSHYIADAIQISDGRPLRINQTQLSTIVLPNLERLAGLVAEGARVHTNLTAIRKNGIYRVVGSAPPKLRPTGDPELSRDMERTMTKLCESGTLDQVIHFARRIERALSTYELDWMDLHDCVRLHTLATHLPKLSVAPTTQPLRFSGPDPFERPTISPRAMRITVLDVLQPYFPMHPQKYFGSLMAFPIRTEFRPHHFVLLLEQRLRLRTSPEEGTFLDYFPIIRAAFYDDRMTACASFRGAPAFPRQYNAVHWKRASVFDREMGDGIFAERPTARENLCEAWEAVTKWFISVSEDQWCDLPRLRDDWEWARWTKGRERLRAYGAALNDPTAPTLTYTTELLHFDKFPPQHPRGVILRL